MKTKKSINVNALVKRLRKEAERYIERKKAEKKEAYMKKKAALKGVPPEKVMADRLQNYALRHSNSLISTYLWCRKKGAEDLPDEGKYRKMAEGHYKDMCAIATMLSNHKFEKAYDKLKKLDTKMRSQIPYLWVEKDPSAMDPKHKSPIPLYVWKYLQKVTK